MLKMEPLKLSNQHFLMDTMHMELLYIQLTPIFVRIINDIFK